MMPRTLCALALLFVLSGAGLAGAFTTNLPSVGQAFYYQDAEILTLAFLGSGVGSTSVCSGSQQNAPNSMVLDFTGGTVTFEDLSTVSAGAAAITVATADVQNLRIDIVSVAPATGTMTYTQGVADGGNAPPALPISGGGIHHVICAYIIVPPNAVHLTAADNISDKRMVVGLNRGYLYIGTSGVNNQLPLFTGSATATTSKVTLTPPTTAATLQFAADNATLIFPAVGTDTLVSRTSIDTLTNKTLTAATLGTSYLSTTKTAGSTGTTANLVAKLNSAGSVVTAAVSDVGILGIAVSTKTSGQAVEVATRGVIDCIADNTTVIGNILIPGTSTAGRCRDSGQTDTTSIGAGTQVLGKALTVVSAGSAVSVQFYGPGHYGTQPSFTASSTDALTNKTLDAEGTGNVLKMPVSVWVPAAGCDNATAGTVFDQPTSNGGTAACFGTSPHRFGALNFIDGANALTSTISVHIPSDWDSTKAVDVKFIWFSASTSTNSIVLTLQTVCIADGEDLLAPTYNAAQTVTDANNATANTRNSASITSVTMTGCAGGELLYLRVGRDPTNGSDTLAATVSLIGVELTFRRSI